MLILQTQYKFFSLLARAGQPIGFWEIPGFEGAKCAFGGTVPTGWTDWTGNNVYTALKRGEILAHHEAIGAGDQIYYANDDPYNTLILWDYEALGQKDRLQLLIETQKLVALENLNYMGDPIKWNETQQLDVVQYQPNQDRSLTSTTSGNEVNYVLTKRSILLVPAEVHISISIPPAKGDAASHNSGWQEGDWKTMELWFKLDFTVWNTIASSYADDDHMSEWVSDYFKSVDAYNKNSIYNIKGGFPIAGWVQGYLENIGPEWPDDYDDEIWKKVKSDEGYKQTLTEASYKSTLDAKTQTLPALQGRSIALFSNPADPTEAYTGDYSGFVTILEQARVYPWAQGQAPAYFPITIQSLGTHTEGGGFWQLGPWDIFYPAVNYRLRVIYAVYGEFTYLWTVKTAEDLGYPGWQERPYEWVHVSAPSWLESLTGLFSNPIFLFFLFLFLILAILVILAIFAPGIFTLISKAAEKKAQSIAPQPPLPPTFGGKRKRRR